MKPAKHRLCLCCAEAFDADRRNASHQPYCSAPACRKSVESARLECQAGETGLPQRPRGRCEQIWRHYGAQIQAIWREQRGTGATASVDSNEEPF